MKYLKLLSVLVFLAISNILISQNQGVFEELKKSMIDNNSAFKQIMKNSSLLTSSFDLCGESFTWDSLSQQFVFTGRSFIEFVEEDDQKTLTYDLEIFGDEESNYIRFVNYFSFQDLIFLDDVESDSSLLYMGDANGNYKLLSRTINYFVDGKVMLTEEFFDYSLVGLPFGTEKSLETRYYYDEENHLVAEASDNFDFSTFSLIFSDSTSYVNNALGLPVEKIDYQPEFFSGEVNPYNKEDYAYINESQLEETIRYFFDGNDFIISNKEVYEYDEMDRRSAWILYSTEDNGLNFNPTDRTMANYEEVLPFDIPSSELTQLYVKEEWQNESLNTLEKCIIDNTEEFNAEIEVWIDKNTLYLKDFEIDGNTRLSIYSMSGQLLFKFSGYQVEQKMDVSTLIPGIYAVEIRTKEGKHVEKVVKSN